MYDFPWITSDTLADSRLGEELLKRGYGDRAISILVPINWIGELDIFDNFRLQDPYAPDALGIGDYGRYYYVESITYDFMQDRLTIKAIDLQFIVRQCVLLGDCATLPDTWEAASEEQRLYGFLGHCDGIDCAFSDGEPCKVLCPCD